MCHNNYVDLPPFCTSFVSVLNVIVALRKVHKRSYSVSHEYVGLVELKSIPSSDSGIPSSARNQPLEMLQSYEDWPAETPTIILDIPVIQAEEHHTDEELRSLTLEALRVAYPSTTWARAYTYGSAEDAVTNGGGGVFIKLPDGRSIRKSVATGQQSKNY